MMTQSAVGQAAEPEVSGGVRIWRLQYGPCWCRGVPDDKSSFDFVRVGTSQAPLAGAEHNVLVVSDRVIDGARPVFLQMLDRVPEPRVVVAARTCPAADSFWDELPTGWSPVTQVIPVDISVPDCVTGHPEALLAALLGHLLRQSDSHPTRIALTAEVGGGR